MDLRNAHLLVVDDNEANRLLVRTLVTQWRGRCDEAVDAHQAIAMLRSAAAQGDRYDLALLDMQMPDADGLALARWIREDLALAQTPLILITSLGYQSAANHDGLFIAQIAKPLRQSQLREQRSHWRWVSAHSRPRQRPIPRWKRRLRRGRCASCWLKTTSSIKRWR
ncbi:MAG: hypothetical protein CUN48_14615 [Candidatus Thermofonsia Clade 3 bacterium]|uniref:Response regulatory domain-containing protein n=1 Tax=Candidatus Thermofonsia Clade 3 bacterium TaxID=2364212 RepID=A0A2M8Q8Z0_9CHLR|nr:MAG: hypothetical protein CUN48_14615 [Candidatus Thermofonsia Clade 3 bacterium]